MMSEKYDKITSKDNVVIKKIVKLANSSSYRHELGQAVIYGEHLVEEAIKYNLLDKMIVEEASLNKYQHLCDLVNSVMLVSHDVMKKLHLLDTATNIIGIIKVGAAVISNRVYCEDCVLLDNISDPGNLGAIFRVAQASGVKNVLLSDGCVDPYNPKVLRASQGIQFGLHVYTKVNLKVFIANYVGDVIATSSYAATSLYSYNLTHNKIAWLFGNEGTGVSGDLLTNINNQVKIPLQGGAESLNVMVASAICLFEMLRQRST